MTQQLQLIRALSRLKREGAITSNRKLMLKVLVAYSGDRCEVIAGKLGWKTDQLNLQLGTFAGLMKPEMGEPKPMYPDKPYDKTPFWYGYFVEFDETLKTWTLHSYVEPAIKAVL